MTDADGDRIAPVTYLFRARPEDDAEQPDSPSATVRGNDSWAPAANSIESPSPAADAPVVSAAVAPAEPVAEQHRGPIFVDLGDPGAADARAAEVRAELEREALHHVSRDRREAAEPHKKGSFDRISNVSMYALARRGMSSREMRDYLVGRDFESVDVDQEVERLESVGLLDDVLLAETLVRTLRDRKGLGRSSLTAELRRRNLDPLAIEIALAALEDDELERAIEIAHKRAGQLRSYDAETAKRRLGAFLQRKGYSGSIVSTAVQRALAPSGPTFR